MTDYTNIETKKGKKIPVASIDRYDYVCLGKDFPSLWWVLFWLIFFYPAIIVWFLIGLSRNKYEVRIRYASGVHETVELSQDELDKLVAMSE